MNKKRKPSQISQKEWEAVESPELTQEWFKSARAASEIDPELVAASEHGRLKYRGQRGPQKAPTKERISIRLSQDVLKYFRGKGDGWQARVDRALMAFVEAAE